jgi:hypothetical protein
MSANPNNFDDIGTPVTSGGEGIASAGEADVIAYEDTTGTPITSGGETNALDGGTPVTTGGDG